MENKGEPLSPLSKDLFERVRSKVDIVDVVRKYLPDLRPAGKGRFKACCPFHSENTPSFFVNSERQVYHCFGDGGGGDVIAFVANIEHISHQEAANMLSRWPAFSPRTLPRRSARRHPVRKPTDANRERRWAEYLAAKIAVAELQGLPIVRRGPYLFIKRFHAAPKVPRPSRAVLRAAQNPPDARQFRGARVQPAYAPGDWWYPGDPGTVEFASERQGTAYAAAVDRWRTACVNAEEFDRREMAVPGLGVPEALSVGDGTSLCSGLLTGRLPHRNPLTLAGWWELLTLKPLDPILRGIPAQKRKLAARPDRQRAAASIALEDRSSSFEVRELSAEWVERKLRSDQHVGWWKYELGRRARTVQGKAGLKEFVLRHYRRKDAPDLACSRAGASPRIWFQLIAGRQQARLGLARIVPGRSWPLVRADIEARGILQEALQRPLEPRRPTLTVV